MGFEKLPGSLLHLVWEMCTQVGFIREGVEGVCKRWNQEAKKMFLRSKYSFRYLGYTSATNFPYGSKQMGHHVAKRLHNFIFFYSENRDIKRKIEFPRKSINMYVPLLEAVAGLDRNKWYLYSIYKNKEIKKVSHHIKFPKTRLCNTSFYNGLAIMVNDWLVFVRNSCLNVTDHKFSLLVKMELEKNPIALELLNKNKICLIFNDGFSVFKIDHENIELLWSRSVCGNIATMGHSFIIVLENSTLTVIDENGKDVIYFFDLFPLFMQCFSRLWVVDNHIFIGFFPKEKDEMDLFLEKQTFPWIHLYKMKL